MGQENTSVFPRLRIDITGQPGSGGSTLSRNLENSLGSERIKRLSGGTLRRAAAYYWNEYLRSRMSAETASMQDCWLDFEQNCLQIYEQSGFDGFLKIIQPYFEYKSNNQILTDFNRNQAKFSQSPFFDRITDEYQLHFIETTDTSYILESKLAVVLRDIVELQQHLKHAPEMALPIIRLYLTVDPNVSAQRITARENISISVEDVLERRSQDWTRYSQDYHFVKTGSALSEADAQQISHLIDTSQLTPKEVLIQALQYIQTELGQVVTEQSLNCDAWLTLLNELLTRPEETFLPEER